MKRATLYERQGTLFIRTSSQTTIGPWLDVGECTCLKADAALGNVGSAVRDHLAASSGGVPFPTSFKDVAKSDPVLRAARVNSWRTFEKLAKCVTIEAEGDRLTITPHKSNRPGFTVIEGAAIQVPAEYDPQLLGEHLQRALDASG